MNTNALLFLGLSVGALQVASGCYSGSGTGGQVGDTSNGGLGEGRGFGGPSGASSAAPPTSNVGSAPGFGGPSGVSTSGPASGDGIGFVPGFGSPGSGSHSGSGTDAPTAGSGAPLPGGGSGVSSGTRLSDLGESDAEQLCAAMEQRILQVLGDQDLRQLSCTLIALGQATSVDSSGQAQVDIELCEESVDACLQSSEPVSTGMLECDTDDLEDCDATVGQQEACFEALLGKARQLAGVLRCEALTDPQTFASQFGPLPAECATLQATCPELAGGDVGSAGSGGSSGGEGGSSGGEGGSSGGEGGSGSTGAGCTNTCRFADDGECDDGGPDSITDFCELGTDCGDCGSR